MLKKFLDEVIVFIVGKQYEQFAELISSKKHVNEFTLAKKLGITINQTRNILYKISGQGLVSSVRKKDKKKGWYTYSWKIEVLKSLEFLQNILVRRINSLKNQIKNRETKKFYICERCNLEFTEEDALLQDFTCNECGDIFTLKDNSRLLREFNRNLEKLSKKLELVQGEIKKEEDKLEKQRLKELKKEQELKKEKRKLKKEARRKLAKKPSVKKPKSKIKKKISETKAKIKTKKPIDKINKNTKKKKKKVLIKKAVTKKTVKKKSSKKK